MSLTVFASLEIYNVLQTIITGGSYYDPSFVKNFLINKLVNFTVSAVASFLVDWLARDELRKVL